jgi:uncharacterized membrane protein YozB (DUF420 family)
MNTDWWRRPWVAPMMMISVAFVAFSLPRYLTLDPAQSRVPQPGGFTAHYPILVAHVVFGSIALLTCGLQVWPWLRQRHPRAHRVIGRIYVFGGVLPAGLMALTIGAVSPFGPLLQVGNVLLASLWLAFTFTGYRMARQRRFADHRRWMIRSFALTASIITNRIWGAVAVIVLEPQIDTVFGGSMIAFQQTVAGISGWLGWTGTLLIAEWWLERTISGRRRASRPARRVQPDRPTADTPL